MHQSIQSKCHKQSISLFFNFSLFFLHPNGDVNGVERKVAIFFIYLFSINGN